MQKYIEFEKFFVIDEFEEGWGMEDEIWDEQLIDYCVEVLYIPSEKIEDLNMDNKLNLEITLANLELDDIRDDWYVNLKKISNNIY